MPKISVIVPCYNVEAYLDRCMNSFINQTIGLKNLEIIFVDDASTDSTLNILKQFKRSYPDSIVIVEAPENRKQGAARNLGLKYASCEYISFVDADDWVDCTMYEKFYSKILEYDYDVVVSRFVFDYSDQHSETHVGERDTSIIIDDGDLLKHWRIDLGSGAVGKLYKKSIVLENKLWFPENLIYEDNYWCSVLKFYLNSVYNMEEGLYHYCVRLDSTVTELNSQKHLDRLSIELMKLEKFKELGVFNACYEEIELDFLKLYYVNTLHILFTKFNPVPFKLVQDIIKNTYETFPNFRQNKYLREDRKLFHVFLNYLDKNLAETDLQRIALGYLKSIRNSIK